MGAWYQEGGHSHNQYVLAMQVFRVLILHGVLVLSLPTLVNTIRNIRYSTCLSSSMGPRIYHNMLNHYPWYMLDGVNRWNIWVTPSTSNNCIAFGSVMYSGLRVLLSSFCKFHINCNKNYHRSANNFQLAAIYILVQTKFVWAQAKIGKDILGLRLSMLIMGVYLCMHVALYRKLPT